MSATTASRRSPGVAALVLATACSAPEPKQVFVEALLPPGIGSCVVQRSVRLTDEAGVTLVEARGDARPADAGEPALRVEAPIDARPFAVVVEEIGACDQVAARATARLDPDSRELLGPLVWGPAACPKDLFAAIPPDGGVLSLGCPPSVCAVEVTRRACGVDLRVRAERASCGLRAGASVSVRADGTLAVQGECGGAKLGPRTLELEGCGPRCPVRLEAAVGGPPLELVEAVDLVQRAGCSRTASAGAGVPVPVGGGRLGLAVRGDGGCGDFGLFDPATGSFVPVADARFRPLAAIDGRWLLGARATAGGGARLVSLSLERREEHELFALEPAPEVTVETNGAVAAGGVLVVYGTRSDREGRPVEPFLLGLQLSAGATVARVRYELRPDRPSRSYVDAVASPRGGRVRLARAELSSAGLTQYSLEDREVDTGALVTKLSPEEGFTDRPKLLRDAPRERTIVFADAGSATCDADLRCTFERSRAWSGDYQDAVVTEGGRYVIGAVTQDGIVVVHDGTDLSLVPGGAIAPPGTGAPPPSARLHVEPDGEHIDVLRLDTGMLERYRLRPE